jgi:hypothetical protein
MATTTIPPQQHSDETPSALEVSTYDRTATMVLALLIMAGTTVLCLSLIFFANKFDSKVQPIALVPVEATSPGGNQGYGTDPGPPGIADAPELSEPGLQDMLAAVASPDALNAAVVSDAILSDRTIRAAGDEAGRGEGLGDARQAGPGGDGVIERVPRWERWKIRFEPSSAGDFAKWLDQFKIRVGVLGRDNKVHVAWGFAAGSPQVEAAEPKTYNAWGQTLPADGPMPALTQQLARDAGIMQFGRIALLFYPFEVEALLYTLEKEWNKSGDANKIRETVFTVVLAGGEYQFKVIDQKYF